MLTLLMSAVMFFPQGRTSDQANANKHDLDGSWTVLCYERDGQPVSEAKNATVTIKDNTVTFQAKDGTTKIKTMRCEFGKPGHIRVTESAASTQNGNDGNGSGNEKAKEGVVVCTKDYLAICLHDENASTTQTDGASSPSTKSKCTVILKREGSSR